jgi:UDP-3-O-[3-hydroxymyristoyl] glucosamine N-acyltransferase
MNTITLDQIHDFLNQNNIPCQIVRAEREINQTQFSFASIKNCIENGVYYFEDSASISKYNIINSIIISKEKNDSPSNCFILVDSPQLVHYKLCGLVKPTVEYTVSPTSKIHPEAALHPRVSIGENCVVGHCIVEEGVVIKHNVVIEDNVVIKKNSFIDSNSVIGASGLAWIWDHDGKRVLQPQLGGVIIEEDCHLATDVTVVRGSLSEYTKIGRGTVIAHGTKIGHGAQIHEEVHMANNVSIAGNAVIGERSFLGSACVISSNVFIAPNCIVGAGAVVNKSHLVEFQTLAGVPAKCIKENNFESKPNGAPQPKINKQTK